MTSQNVNPAGNAIVTHMTNGTTTPTSAGIQMVDSSERSGEFEQFEALAARLVRVPKSELDEQRA